MSRRLLRGRGLSYAGPAGGGHQLPGVGVALLARLRPGVPALHRLVRVRPGHAVQGPRLRRGRVRERRGADDARLRRRGPRRRCRCAWPSIAEAASGFAALSAAIAFVISIYPLLSQLRSTGIQMADSGALELEGAARVVREAGPVGAGRGGAGAHREPRAPAPVPRPLLLRVGQRRGVTERVPAGQRHAAGGPPLRPRRGGRARPRLRRRARTHRRAGCSTTWNATSSAAATPRRTTARTDDGRHRRQAERRPAASWRRVPTTTPSATTTATSSGPCWPGWSRCSRRWPRSTATTPGPCSTERARAGGRCRRCPRSPTDSPMWWSWSPAGRAGCRPGGRCRPWRS